MCPRKVAEFGARMGILIIINTDSLVTELGCWKEKEN